MIAILLATYNCEEYIRQQLDSLLNQTYKDFVCYIHDDGSSDKTMEIINQYCIKYPTVFKILDYPVRGASKKNFMSMLEYISEEYVMFCDHDDVWLPEKIEISIATMRKIEENTQDKPILIFTDLKVVDRNLNIICNSFMKYTGMNPKNIEFSSLLIRNIAPGCTMLFNKQLYLIARKCSNLDNIKMHDSWLMLIAAACGKIQYIDTPLILYRQHLSNVVGAEKVEKNFQRIKKNIINILNGSFGKKQRQWINEILLQSEELSKLVEIPNDKRKIAKELSEVKRKMNKIERILFLRKYGIRRQKNNWWLLLWI
ncbi:glycosyltransferase family 2 protein [Clostridium thermarum]|uniref:glycosyltransferase family 2 protein n=1 Tax=Clostridium thermarum TaxID=1716543 RepID=UPI0013D010B5|nr:glycosyltransferase family 2 protein [Clostridium thermarum]